MFAIFILSEDEYFPNGYSQFLNNPFENMMLKMVPWLPFSVWKLSLTHVLGTSVAWPLCVEVLATFKL